MQRIITVFFVISLALLPVLCFASPDQEFSEIENRFLQQQPSFSWGKLLDGKYTKEVTSYVQDQFWQRSFWIKVKNSSDKALGRQDIGKTYLARIDGIYYEQRPKIVQRQWHENLKALDELIIFAKEKGMESWFLGVYSRSHIYPENLPSFTPIEDERILARDIAELNPDLHYVDTLSSLIQAKQEEIFFRTDHHWTARGAYYGYVNLIEAMSLEAKALDSYQEEKLSGFYGTLYSRAPLFGVQADDLIYYKDDNEIVKMQAGSQVASQEGVLDFSKAEVKDKYMIFLGGVQPLLVINTEARAERKALIVKDSFAHPLIPFLTNHYDEIHVVDLRYYRLSLEEYILDHDFDDLILIYNLSWFAADQDFAFFE